MESLELFNLQIYNFFQDGFFLYFRIVKATSSSKSKAEKRAIALDDFFGETKDYYLYAVQSDDSLMPMAAHLKELLRCDIHYIGDYQLSDNQANPLFPVFHARIDGGDPIDFFLVENKTLRYDSAAVPFIPDKDNPFPTMDLFEEFYYIFNAGRKLLFKWDLADIPFLFLFSISKDTEVSSLVQLFSQLPRTRTIDKSNLLKGKGKKVEEIEKMYCVLDMMAAEADKQRTLQHLSGSHTLPENVQRRYMHIPVNVTANATYLKMLKEDQTFERSLINQSF